MYVHRNFFSDIKLIEITQVNLTKIIGHAIQPFQSAGENKKLTLLFNQAAVKCARTVLTVLNEAEIEGGTPLPSVKIQKDQGRQCAALRTERVKRYTPKKSVRNMSCFRALVLKRGPHIL